VRRKRWGIIGLLLLLLLLVAALPIVSGTVFADAGGASGEGEKELLENIRELLSNLDTEELQEYISSLSTFDGWEVKEKIAELVNGGITDYSNVYSAIFSLITDEIKELLPSFVVICAISVLCGILNTVKNSFLSDATSDIIFFVCYAAAIVVLFFRLFAVFEACEACMNGLKKQMEIVFPLLLTLMAASGGSVSAAVYNPAVVFLCDGISSVLTKIVLPFTLIVMILQLVSHLNKNIKTDGFIRLFKSANKWLIGVSVTVFGIFLSVQGLTAASYDGISLRAAKYAISNSVPIVGNFLSGGFDLVLAGNALIKNSVGIIGVFMILSVVAEPLVMLISFSLLLRLSAAVSEPIGDERLCSFQSNLSDSLGYLTASLFSLAFLYFLTILLLICSAGVIF
jgi:stage III sporulation protein AE